MSPSNLAALVIAASFAAGLNLYATILVLGMLARVHLATLPPGLDVLGHTWVLVTCGVLFVAEFVADKIPVLDLLWNVLHTFIRIPVAALIAWHATTQLSPGMQVAAASLGAVIAALAHSSKIAARAAVTPSPEPISNIALSTASDGAAIGLTWFATHHPVPAAILALCLLLAAGLAARALLRAAQRVFARLRSLGESQPASPPLLP